MTYEVNVLALLIGTVFNMLLGALWYSPLLFAKPWMREAGITEENIKNSKDKMGVVYGLTAVGALLTSYVIGFLVVNLGLTTIGQAIIAAIIVWAGTNIPTIIKNWGFEDRTILLGIINHSYDLLVYSIVAIIYVLFL